MYTLTKFETQKYHSLELTSPDGRSKAVFYLNQGGRLANLVFENLQILADYSPLDYTDNYASSILFPFANRIRNGEYHFNGLNYKLKCNEVDKDNALHGLIYNKTFNCTRTELSSDRAIITLKYTDNGTSKGFPFKFDIELTYTLDNRGISLSVKVRNIDKTSFPFSLGWHPYFLSKDLYESTIHFQDNPNQLLSREQIESNRNNLTNKSPLSLKGLTLDNNYHLETNEVKFSTPEYNLSITSTSEKNFLQLYTPNQPNIIAVEPMTGPPNNFRNKIDLQILNPGKKYNVKWNIEIQNLLNKN